MSKRIGLLLFLVSVIIIQSVGINISSVKCESNSVSASITQVWRFTTDYPVYFEPVVSGNFLYAMSANVSSDISTLYCLDASQGTQKWNYTFSFAYLQTPNLDGKHAYVTSIAYAGSGTSFRGSSVLHALNAITGAEEWSYHTEGAMTAPIVELGTIYFQSAGIVYALDASTGKEIWKYTTNRFVDIAIAEGDVYLSFNDINVQGTLVSSSILALDTFTGLVMWNYTSLDGVNVVVPGRWLYIGSPTTDVVAVDPSEGVKVWNTTLKYGGFPLVAGSFVYVRSDNDLVALDASTGAKKWSYTFPDSVAGLSFSNPYLYAGSGKDLFCFDGSTGGRKWVYTATEEPFVPFSIFGSRVYIGSSNISESGLSNISALDALTGEKLWNYAIEGYSRSITVAGETVYVGTEGIGSVYALKVTEGNMPPQPVPLSLFELLLLGVTLVVAVVAIVAAVVYLKKRKR